ncbi:MAG: ABC transporter ATP-binding protein [Clostridia bacterium]|nr:ABC transporter ATP-binding protein [Clostridia bacterium]
MPLLTVNNLSIGYDSNIVAENLSFCVNPGDYLCIVGENGSGKTTLMRTILGLKDRKSGQIMFGEDLKQNEIGYLPQQTSLQKDFPASVREIVLSGCQGKCGLSPFYTKEDRLLANTNMEKMGITEFANRCYRELSGGQQQRVLLARALCATKRLLLLDEPVSGLDPNVTANMYELVKKLNEEGITIIMISHDIQAAIKYASHILHIDKQIFFGTREEYVSSEFGKRFLAIKGGEAL